MTSARPSATERWLAAHRLRMERTRPSVPGADVAGERRLYRDVAGILATPAGRPTGVAQRTRVVDAEVARAIGRGTSQLVLLGAGYDGRALRFGGGASHWFEVDLPATQADKRRRLDAFGIEPAGVSYLPLDLETGDLDAGLDAAGHDRAAPSLFVCEGLLAHLTLAAAATLCETLQARAPDGSTLVADFAVSPEPGTPARAIRAANAALLHVAGEPRRQEFRPGDPEKLMVVTGWRVTHSESSAESRLDRGSHMRILVCEPERER